MFGLVCLVAATLVAAGVGTGLDDACVCVDVCTEGTCVCICDGDCVVSCGEGDGVLFCASWRGEGLCDF